MRYNKQMFIDFYYDNLELFVDIPGIELCEPLVQATEDNSNETAQDQN
jgi:hypothetical protein